MKKKSTQKIQCFALILELCAAFFVSCNSKSDFFANATKTARIKSEKTKKTNSKSKKATKKNTIIVIEESKKNTEDAPNPSDELLKRQQLENLKITVQSSPGETEKGKPFPAPYKILVTSKDGVPQPFFSITAEYPSSRAATSISLARETLVSDQNGRIDFMPKTPNFSVKSKVSFYPQVPSSNPEIIRLCSVAMATAPWVVRTNLTSRTGILVSIVDYDENGKMILNNTSQTSTQALERFLWQNGLMGAHNADFHNAIDVDDAVRIRNDAIKLIMDNTKFAYIIYGRVKYARKITQDADGFFSASFEGDIGALDIGTGELLIKSVKSVMVKDKTQWKLVTLARDEMAKLFAEEILYGL